MPKRSGPPLLTRMTDDEALAIVEAMMRRPGGPPAEFSFESAYELILRKRRRKAAGLSVDQGGPRRVKTVAD